MADRSSVQQSQDTTAFVSGIGSSTTIEDVVSFFFDRQLDISHVLAPEPGTAFIRFVDRETLQRALSITGASLGGQSLQIVHSREQKPGESPKEPVATFATHGVTATATSVQMTRENEDLARTLEKLTASSVFHVARSLSSLPSPSLEELAAMVPKRAAAEPSSVAVLRKLVVLLADEGVSDSTKERTVKFMELVVKQCHGLFQHLINSRDQGLVGLSSLIAELFLDGITPGKLIRWCFQSLLADVQDPSSVMVEAFTAMMSISRKRLTATDLGRQFVQNYTQRARKIRPESLPDHARAALESALSPLPTEHWPATAAPAATVPESQGPATWCLPYQMSRGLPRIGSGNGDPAEASTLRRQLTLSIADVLHRVLDEMTGALRQVIAAVFGRFPGSGIRFRSEYGSRTMIETSDSKVFAGCSASWHPLPLLDCFASFSDAWASILGADKHVILFSFDELRNHVRRNHAQTAKSASDVMFIMERFFDPIADIFISSGLSEVQRIGEALAEHLDGLKLSLRHSSQVERISAKADTPTEWCEQVLEKLLQDVRDGNETAKQFAIANVCSLLLYEGGSPRGDEDAVIVKRGHRFEWTTSPDDGEDLKLFPWTMKLPNIKPVARSEAVIGAHGGAFHLDDVLACFMLRQLPEYRQARVIRTEKQELLRGCAIVVDVGGEYDHGKRRYDHHQAGFNEVFSPEYAQIKLAAAGLIWKHYGTEVLRALWPQAAQLPPPSDANIELMLPKVYEAFIAAVDAIDNGVDQFPESVVGGVAPLYTDRTTLPSRVKALNPDADERIGEEERRLRFEHACTMAGRELRECIRGLVTNWLCSIPALTKRFRERRAVHPSGHVIHSDTPVTLDSLRPLEVAESLADPEHSSQVLYVIRGKQGGSWTAYAVEKSSGSFTSRLPFPAEWRGQTDKGLSDRARIPGCLFVHASGFMARASNFDGIMAMINASLAQLTVHSKSPSAK